MENTLYEIEKLRERMSEAMNTDGKEWEKFLESEIVFGWVEADGTRHDAKLPMLAEFFDEFDTTLQNIQELIKEDYM